MHNSFQPSWWLSQRVGNQACHFLCGNKYSKRPIFLPVKGTVSSETVYYLLSTPMAPVRFAQAAREHWGVENGLHWSLDVTMDEDRARNRKDNGPENLGILRHFALNLISKEPGKFSKRRKFNKAAWNNAYLLKLIAQI